MQKISRSPSYLIRNPHSYCFRMIIPQDLQPIIGKKELRRSLKTGYLRIAKSKARLIAGRLQEVFRVVRDSSEYGKLPRKEIEATIERAFRDLVNFNERMKAWSGTLTPEDQNRERLKHQESLLQSREALNTNDYSGLKDELESVFERSADALFSEEVDPTEVNQLYRNFLKVKVRYHKLELERLSGDFSTDPQSVFHADMDLEKAKEKQVAQQHIENEQRLIELEKAELLSSLRDELTALLSTISRGAEPVTKAEEPSILLSELWEQFKAEKVKIGRWRSNTIRNHTPKFTAFKQFVGDIPVNYVTKAMARDFRMLLDHLPPNFTKKGYQDFSEITLSDLRDKHDKTLSITTIRDYMLVISAMFNLAVEYDYISVNPVTPGMIPDKKRNAREQRLPFSDPTDLAMLFDKEQFIKWSNNRPERFWAPIISMYTGCRLEEACQLHAEDVKMIEGYWCFDFKGLTAADREGEEEGQMLKNESAPRAVPLHSFLIDVLKLPEYAKGVASGGDQLLFPNMTKGPETNFKYSHALSKAFSRYKNNKVGIKDSKKTFHSFRHTLTDNLKDEGVSEWMIEELQGRAGKSETSKRYSSRFRVPKINEEAISKIKFKVDLSHLKTSKYVPKDTSEPE